MTKTQKRLRFRGGAFYYHFLNTQPPQAVKTIMAARSRATIEIILFFIKVSSIIKQKTF